MVLAAKEEASIFSLANVIPNPTAQVTGKSALQHVFELLVRTGVEEVRANVRYPADALLDCHGETG